MTSVNEKIKRTTHLKGKVHVPMKILDLSSDEYFMPDSVVAKKLS